MIIQNALLLFQLIYPCEEVETERAYFNYFFYCFFPNQISFQQKQVIGFLFSTSKNLICQQVDQLMTYLTQQFPINHLEDKKPILFLFSRTSSYSFGTVR